MKRLARALATLVIVAAAGACGYQLWNAYMLSPWTRDARVQADVVMIAPQVAGDVTDLRVKDDQFVHKGDVLFEIDADDYRIALDRALAEEQHDRASLDYARENEQRKASLMPQGAISKDTFQKTTSALHEAEAAIALDEAAIAKARLDLRAPVNGFITNLTLVTGQYASIGTRLMALIDSDSYRVEGYFEETKIPGIALGDRVDIHLLNGQPALRGHVESISRGITDRDNNSGPELLANVTPTFEWVRLAQRIPVRIHIDQIPEGVLISSGMTCTVRVEAPPRPSAIGELLRSGDSLVTSWLSRRTESQPHQGASPKNL
jgi:multidrug resistance efflux pump